MVEVDYRYVGYFPTVNLLKILQLFGGGEKAQICKIKAFRNWRVRKSITKPIPYVKITNSVDKNIEIDYSHLRHGNLNLKTLTSIITRAGADLVVAEELCMMLPIKAVFDEGEIKGKGWTKRSLVATFIGHYAKAPNSGYRKILEEHMSKGELIARIKHSSLDLVSLQDAHFWVRSSRKGYYKEYKKGIMEDLRPIRRIVGAIDPDGALGRWRHYQKGKADAWVLVADKSILEG